MGARLSQCFVLIQRCSRRSHKAAIIPEAISPCPFGDVGSNTVCGPNDLFPNRVPSEAIPTADRPLNFIGQSFRQLVNLQPLKIGAGHV
jgi:hypothetical protein